MTTNCPNCGAPIDIHRVSCEYCGTPYERDDIHVRQSEEMIFYADNKPVYIYQEPLNIDPIEIQKRILEAQNRRLRNELNAAIAGVNNTMSISSALNTLNANVLSSGMHGSGKIEECLNSIPRAESSSSTADCVPGIWEDPVCPEHSMLKDILLLLAMFAPVIVFIFLKVFNII